MREYFIIFHDSDEPHLRWMKKGFRHAFLAIYEGQMTGTLTILDLLSGSYRIENVKGVRLVALEDYWTVQGYTFVRVQPGYARVWLPGPLSCVTVIKRFLGLVKPMIITPFQLWKYLDNKDKADNLRTNKGYI